jgi:hypothetical protein
MLRDFVAFAFIPEEFETLAGGKRSATTGRLVLTDVSRRDTRIRAFWHPSGMRRCRGGVSGGGAVLTTG